jgi:hypothetical protein
LPAARWGLAGLALAASLTAAPSSAQAVNPIPYGYRPPPTMHPVNQLPPFITAGLYRRYLRPGATVVIVTHRGNAGMLFQADADFYFRIAGGFINASLTPQDALPPDVKLVANPSAAADRKFEDYIRSSGVGAIVVEQAWEDTWMRNYSIKLGMHGISVGGVTIYPTAPWLAQLARTPATRPAAPHLRHRAAARPPAPPATSLA